MLQLFLIIIAGLANGIMDLVTFRWDLAPGWMRNKRYFWDPSVSWRNKWGDDISTEKFFLSSSVLVFLTDGWHLCKEIMLSSIIAALAINFTPAGAAGFFTYFVIFRLSFAIGFYLFYKK